MSPRRPVTRRLAFFSTGVVASVALVSGPALAVSAMRDPDPLPAAPVAQPVVPSAGPGPSATLADTTRSAQEAAASRPSDFGAFLHYGPPGLAYMQKFSKWLGGTEVRVAHTYLPGDLWSNIEGLPGFLDKWAEWRRAKSDRLFVLNVPMMERNEEKLSDEQVRKLLGRAADGEFDVHFKRLAQRLVDLGVPDTVLVVGWEMNGISYTHRCGPDPENWKAYWKRIVNVMRSVPGQKFKFDFAPSRGMDAIPWTECYPGDEYVDIVGMDSYDQPRGMSFNRQVSEPYGLQHHVDFAKAHGKEISYPEWGLYRNGDNVNYMLRMLAWIDEHRPLYHTLTDYCPHGLWKCKENPRSAALFRALMTSQTKKPASTPPAKPKPKPKPKPSTSASSSADLSPAPSPKPSTSADLPPASSPKPKPEPEPEPSATVSPAPKPSPSPSPAA